MSCPYCTNADVRLIEALPPREGWRRWLCQVCSRVWREPQKEQVER